MKRSIDKEKQAPQHNEVSNRTQIVFLIRFRVLSLVPAFICIFQQQSCINRCALYMFSDVRGHIFYLYGCPVPPPWLSFITNYFTWMPTCNEAVQWIHRAAFPPLFPLCTALIKWARIPWELECQSVKHVHDLKWH